MIHRCEIFIKTVIVVCIFTSCVTTFCLVFTKYTECQLLGYLQQSTTGIMLAEKLLIKGENQNHAIERKETRTCARIMVDDEIFKQANENVGCVFNRDDR